MNSTCLLVFLLLLMVCGCCLVFLSFGCTLTGVDDGSFCLSTSWSVYDSFYGPSASRTAAFTGGVNHSINDSLSGFALLDRFTISPSACSRHSTPFLLLIIFSRPDAAERRKTIRQTFGSVQQQCPAQIRIFFILGQVQRPDLQRSLEEEAAEYHDIIQSAGFEDGYGQATRKGLSLLYWSLLNCPDAQFTAKGDDDCWMNLPDYLDILHRNKDQQKILGLLWPKGAAVIRDTKNKWFVSISDYAEERFPPYVSGILYAFHRDVIARVVQAATQLKYLWHDDVFLTGIAAKAADVGHVSLAGYDVKGDAWARACSKRSLLAIHYVDDAKMNRLWKDPCATYNITC